MLTKCVEIGRLVLVRMNSGDDLLESLQTAVKENGVSNGVIISGAGSLKSYRFHVVETTDLPPGEVFVEREEAVDILTVTGAVMDGRVHAHVTFSNEDRAMGGHVHEGCRVLTFAIAVIAETPNADLADWDSMRML